LITLYEEGEKKKGVSFDSVVGEKVVVKVEDKAETIEASKIYMVRNDTARNRALEMYLKSKGFKEGDCFTFKEPDGTIHLGKFVKGEEGLEIETDASGVEISWSFIDEIEALTSEEYAARMKRLKKSESQYSPVVKPGENARTLETALGKPEREGPGISGRINMEGADSLGLYTRFFKNEALWVSSRKGIVYEVETDKGFKGKIYGMMIGSRLEDALKMTDLHFWRSNLNNPKILISNTLHPVQVKIMLDDKLKIVEKIKVTDLNAAGNWVVKAGVIMRRLDKK
jgi:RNase P/RNase MRP subunit p29